AVVAGEFPDDVILIGSPGGIQDLLAACFEVRKATLRDLQLSRQIFALWCVAERLREKKLVVAISVELRLADVECAIDDANFILNARQLAAGLAALGVLLYEALFELVADRVFRRIVSG